jgi:pimeloyl-ACP methyl ester carboxylesterase
MAGRPRVLLLHGFLSGSACWEPLRRHLDGVADCLAPDLPGYGGSPGPGRAEEYTLPALVEALAPFVDSEAPTHVLGHSMGGILALGLASRFPGRFEGLGVVGLPVYADRTEALGHLNRQGFVRRAFLRSHRVSHQACRAMYLSRWGWAPLSPFVVGRAYSPRVLSTAFKHSAAGHAGALDGIVFGGHVPALGAAAGTEVVLFHGDRDRAAPLLPVRELAASRGWELTVAPGSGHQVIIERPRMTARWVRSRLLARPASAWLPPADKTDLVR